MTKEALVEKAIEAMQGAYAPYSGFQVGAALLTEDGTLFTGCNIENASFGATNCAERTAIFKAVSEGHRSFREIAIVGGLGGVISAIAAPCGICRQVMREFCEDDFPIHLFDGNKITTYTLSELLPLGFRKCDLK